MRRALFAVEYADQRIIADNLKYIFEHLTLVESKLGELDKIPYNKCTLSILLQFSSE